MRIIENGFVVALIVVSACMSPALAGTAIWESVFTGTPVPVPASIHSGILSTADGSLYVTGVFQPYGRSVTARVDPLTANVIWSGSATGLEGASRPLSLVLTDNSLLTITDIIMRIDQSGAMVWAIPNPSQGVPTAAAQLENGRIVIAVAENTGARIRILDLESGVALESLAIPDPSSEYCGGSRVTLRTLGNAIYLAAPCKHGIIRLDTSPLGVAWSLPPSIPDILQVNLQSQIAVDATGLYVTGQGTSGNVLARFSPVDGSPAWQTALSGTAIKLVVAADADLLVLSGTNSSSSTGKFSATTGAPVWTRDEPGRPADMAATANTIIVVGNVESPAPDFDDLGFFLRLDLNTGVPIWRRDAPPSALHESRLQQVAISGTRILAIGADCAVPEYDERCTTGIWLTDLASGGSVASTLPSFGVDAIGTTNADTDDHTLAAALLWGANGQMIEVRRIRNVDGVVTWTSSFAVPPDYRGIVPERLEVIRTGDGNVVVAYGRQGSHVSNFPYSRVELVKFDAVSGAVVWNRSLTENQQGVVGGEMGPLRSDAAGNLFVAVHDQIFDFPSGTTTERRSVLKLDGATGLQHWRREFAVCGFCASNSPPLIRALAADVLVIESPAEPVNTIWTRLHGADGSTAWSNPMLYSQPVVFDSDAAIELRSTGNQLEIRKVELSGGTVVWTSNYSNPDDNSYSMQTALLGPNGEIYVGGSRNNAQGRKGLLLRIDGSTGAVDWSQRMAFDPAPSLAVHPRLVTDATLQVSQSQVPDDRLDYSYFLTGIDTGTGALRGTQLLTRGFWNQPNHVHESVGGIFRYTAKGFVVVPSSRFIPAEPRTFRVHSLPPPNESLPGSLGVTLDLQSGPHGTPVHFTFRTTNSGATTALDAEALLAIPANARVTSADCELAGAPCDALVTATSIGGTFDFPAGAVLEITGTLQTLSGDARPAKISASTYAPYGFSEPDMKDNRASAVLWDRIFTYGFE